MLHLFLNLYQIVNLTKFRFQLDHAIASMPSQASLAAYLLASTPILQPKELRSSKKIQSDVTTWQHVCVTS